MKNVRDRDTLKLMRDYFSGQFESRIISGATLLFLFANPYLESRRYFDDKPITAQDCPLVLDILRYLKDHQGKYPKLSELPADEVGNNLAQEISSGIKESLIVGNTPSWLEIKKEDMSFRALITFSRVINRIPKIAKAIDKNVRSVQNYILNLEKNSKKPSSNKLSVQRIFQQTKILIGKTQALCHHIAKRDKRLTDLLGFAEHFLYPIPGRILHSSPFLTSYSTTIAERAYNGIGLESEHSFSRLERHNRLPDLMFGQKDEFNFHLTNGSTNGIYDSLRYLNNHPDTEIHSGHFATLFYHHQSANQQEAKLIIELFQKMAAKGRDSESLNRPVNNQEGFLPYDYAMKFGFEHHGGYKNSLLAAALLKEGAISVNSLDDADPLPVPSSVYSPSHSLTPRVL